MPSDADPWALTICRPWPYLILQPASAEIPDWIRETFGPPGKRVENRSWFTNFGGRLLIHAGKSKNWLAGIPQSRFEPLMKFGAIVGRATVYDCVHIGRNRAGEKLIPHSTRNVPRKMLPELVTDPHASGPYCWLLKDIERIDQPVEIAGKQGFWRVPAAALEGRTFERVD